MDVHSKYNQEEAGAEMACHPRTTILWCMTWAPTRKLYKRLGPSYHELVASNTISLSLSTQSWGSLTRLKVLYLFIFNLGTYRTRLRCY
jgi:hypothetical protein